MESSLRARKGVGPALAWLQVSSTAARLGGGQGWVRSAELSSEVLPLPYGPICQRFWVILPLNTHHHLYGLRSNPLSNVHALIWPTLLFLFI